MKSTTDVPPFDDWPDRVLTAGTLDELDIPTTEHRYRTNPRRRNAARSNSRTGT